MDGSRRTTNNRGAALVEFALALPLLALLIFGIIDFGWAFSQNIDLRNAAREGGRLAVVNYGTASDPDARRNEIIAEIKSRSPELDDVATAIRIELVDGADANLTAGDRGDTVVVCIRYPLRSLSGFSSNFLSGDLSTKAVMRMEQLAQFNSGAASTPAWGSEPCTP